MMLTRWKHLNKLEQISLFMLIIINSMQIFECLEMTNVNKNEIEKKKITNTITYQENDKFSKSILNKGSVKVNNSLEYNVLYPNSTINFDFDYANTPEGCSNNYNCFLPYGICLNFTTCMCMPEYANLYVKGISLKELKCSYKKRKVVVAAMLELFLPLGLGHFYAGHFVLGMLKFFYNLFICSFCCFLYSKGTNNEVFTNMMVTCVFLSCLIPLWNIVDLFLFFTDTYKDGYGISLS